ncbi:MAG: FKBP-type peptidyl-prolyl cis-trans isomerase [Halothiobacillus sp.]
MLIEKNIVVRLEYVLTDDDGVVIDTTQGRGFEYIHGHGNLLAPLEAHLEGLREGASFALTIEPEAAYGLHDESAVLIVPRNRFAPEVVLAPGNMVETLGPDGRIELMILAVDGDEVTVDLNHPLAGLRLHFTGTVGVLRAAHADEIKHGRVHPGGHHLMVGDSTYMGDFIHHPGGGGAHDADGGDGGGGD